MEKNVEKQLILRAYEPDMNVLKATAKQLVGMQDVSLNLYGQAKEVLLVITAHSYAPAAATELTEMVAEQFENALGAAAYGRGKGSLAYFTAGELLETEATVAAADAHTGELLGEEFSHTKRGSQVFDFGETSYDDARIADKIDVMACRNFEEGNTAQKAAAYATAAAKYARCEYGVCITDSAEEGKVYVAVAYKGYVYMRRFAQGAEADKRAALTALDTIRLLACKLPTPKAHVFKANTDFDWNDPVRKSPNNPYLAPIVVLAVLLVALGIACWYFFSNFSLGDTTGDAVPVSTGVSDAASVSDDTASDAAASGDTASETETSSDESVAASVSSEAASVGPVRPFG
jgi:nicotinamide mononucleotide (NMN) deamidase PncC